MKALGHGASRFGLAVNMQPSFLARPEFGAAPEDMLVPSYWAHYASRLVPEAMIRVIPEGMPWIADFIVVEANQYTATVKMVSFTDLTKAATRKDAVSSYRVERAGRWVRIIRASDNALVKGNLTSEEEARRWLAENAESDLV